MTEREIVRVKNAPGLHWKKRDGYFEARWQCRDDLVKRPDFKNFAIKSVKLWTGDGDPTLEEWDFIADTCNQLQQEMLVWANGGLPRDVMFDGTIAGLILCYRNDPDSNYKKKGKLRYASRTHYDVMMGMLEREIGHEAVAGIKGRTLSRWYDDWAAGGKVSTAHTKIKMLRILFGFGTALLEDPDCIRLKGVLREMKFAMSKPRSQLLTADQAIAIRAKAWEMGRPSIALAQAFQFELMLRQKDVIGEYVPLSEPGVSDVFYVDEENGVRMKWLRGIRWEEIDESLTLTHVTSKRNKEIKVSLRNAPMVMEELGRLKDRPAKGPIIVSEFDGLPWEAIEFRRWWRKVADACRIDKKIRNMDSRAGAISEAIAAGASLEHVRHGATHSDIAMTQRYDRDAEEAIAIVQRLRSERRNKSGTDE